MSMATADVVVIGGGVIGTAVTYYLAREGVRVVLVEKGGLGAGASTACEGAILMQTKHPGAHLESALQSNEMYATLDGELGCDLEYRRHGSMVVAETPRELEELGKRWAEQRAAALPVEWLDGEESRARQPQLGGEVLASAFCPIDADVNPMRVVAGFATAAQRCGARIQAHSAVTGIRSGGRSSVVETESGEMATETIVNAAGAWAPGLARMVGVSLPIIPRRGMVLVTEALPPVVNGAILSAEYLTSKLAPKTAPPEGRPGPALAGGLVVAQVKRGNVLLGSSREDVGYDNAVTAEGIAHIGRRALRTLPFLRDVAVLRTYAGLRPATPDGRPIVGRVPGVEGFIVAAGHEGDGIALAPWTGRLVADLILGRKAEEDVAHLDLRRFAGEVNCP